MGGRRDGKSAAMPRRRHILTASAGLCGLLPGGARAQRPRPDGPVTFIVPFTPGTTQDLLARLLAPALQAKLGQPVVVDNRAGASGVVGNGAVARAAPDGRTLMIQGVPFVMNPPLMKSLPYDPSSSFTPTQAMMMKAPSTIAGYFRTSASS